MPYTARQLRWAHTASGRAALGDAKVREWDEEVKRSGFKKARDRVARMKARRAMGRSKRRQAGAVHRSVAAKRSAMH